MTMSDPVFEAIGLALLHLLWQGALVAGVLAAALHLIDRKNAAMRYALSCLALAALLAFGVGTAVRIYEPAGEAISNLEAVDSGFPATVAQDPVAPTGVPILELLRLYAPQIVFVWLIGVALLSIRLGVTWFRARRLITAEAVPAAESWQEVVRRLSTSLRLVRPVRLLESAAVEVPSVIGWLRPVILIPVSSLSGLTPDQLEMILAHELAHIRRHDFLVNLVQSIAETLLFYHPAAWWISRQIRIERENCCDDLAVAVCGNALHYARALTMLEELRRAPASAVAANGGSLFARIRRIVTRTEEGRLVNGWTAFAAAIGLVVLMSVASIPMLADYADDTPPPPAPPAAPAPEPEDESTPEPPEPPEAPEALAAYEAYGVQVPPTPVITPAPTVLPTPIVHPAPMVFPAPTIPPTPIVPLAPGHAAPVATPMATPRTPRPLAPLGWPAPAVAAFDVNWDFDDFGDDEKDASATLDSGRQLTVDELIALKIQNVTPAYINEVRSLGFGELRYRDVISLKTHGVTAQYVNDLRAAGVTINTAREARQLKMFNVTPEFVRSLAAAGYTKLTTRELTRLAAAGVNADFIRELSKYKDNKKSNK